VIQEEKKKKEKRLNNKDINFSSDFGVIQKIKRKKITKIFSDEVDGERIEREKKKNKKITVIDSDCLDDYVFFRFLFLFFLFFF
jgi:hypothetical protein